MLISPRYNQAVNKILASGGVGVGPTDTVYGLLAKANDRQAVERVFDLKSRNPTKPCLVLVDSPTMLREFTVADKDIARAGYYWPAPITLVMNVSEPRQYLSRGKSSLAFRMPDNVALRKLISCAGPLIAPSANPEGEPPALSRQQAKSYFKDKVDFYVGTNHPISAQASSILDLTNQKVAQLR